MTTDTTTRKKYGSLFDLYLKFDNGFTMNLCRDLMVLDKQDLLSLIPTTLKGTVLKGAPTFLEPFKVIISVFPQANVLQFRKEILLNFPHFSQSTPWIPHIPIKTAADEREQRELLDELNRTPRHFYVIEEVLLVPSPS